MRWRNKDLVSPYGEAFRNVERDLVGEVRQGRPLKPLSPNTPPPFARIFSTTDPFSFAMSCWLPVTGSETNVMRPWRFVTIRKPCPVVLHFPDHSLPSPFQDQQGHSVPSTGAIAPVVASAASSSDGRSSYVAFSTNGVRNVIYRDIVDWATSKYLPTHPRWCSAADIRGSD